MHYYNENDLYCALWLENLMTAGLIPQGYVDERSIKDVTADDLRGFKQCHFFAGIGGWARAARIAGWPDELEVWTGSPPCQPFSVAGRQGGADDDRHLWPDFFRLIRARRPARVMGEQVAAAVGKDWLDGVLDDLESIGYACRAAVVPACAVNAPHRRDRLWFVADTAGALYHMQREGLEGQRGHDGAAQGWPEPDRPVAEAGDGGAMADAGIQRRQQDARGAHGDEGADEGRAAQVHHVAASDGEGACTMADADLDGRKPRRGDDPAARHGAPASAARGSDHWCESECITGHDGKARRVKPSIPLLAHGVPARVGKLRAYGNAIAPPLAAEVMSAYLDTIKETSNR